MPTARLAKRQRGMPHPGARARSPESACSTPNNATRTRTYVRRICRQIPASAHTNQRCRQDAGVGQVVALLVFELANCKEQRKVHGAPLGYLWQTEDR